METKFTRLIAGSVCLHFYKGYKVAFFEKIGKCFKFLQVGIHRCYIVRYIDTWGLVIISYLLLLCSITTLFIIDVVIIWGNALQCVKITSFLFWLFYSFFGWH